jgi:hypothetical protein
LIKRKAGSAVVGSFYLAAGRAAVADHMRGGADAMEDWKAGLRAELRAIEIATGEAAAAQLPDLLRRLRRHEAGLAGNPVLAVYRRWRIRSLARAVADARWHAEQGRTAQLGGLDTRP